KVLALSSVSLEAADDTGIERPCWLRRDRNAFHECERTIQRLAGALAMRASELLEKRRLLGLELVLTLDIKRARFHCAREGCRQMDRNGHVSSRTLALVNADNPPGVPHRHQH